MIRAISGDPGGTFRDMNLFLDDDGQAYVFYASEDNWTMYVVQLNDQFTGPRVPAVENKTWARILSGKCVKPRPRSKTKATII